MLKFDEQKLIDSVNGGLKLRGRINEIVDEICKEGYKNLCWFGIGGTWASGMQAHAHMKEKTAIDTFVENAAEYCVTGNRRIGEGTVVVISSVTGSTQEVVAGIEMIKETGAKIIGFLDIAGTKLGSLADYEIVYPLNEQLKFFMVADRFMYNAGEFPEYDRCYEEMDKYLAQALVEVGKASDDWAREFALKHKDDPIHYFVGAGNQWGSTYSYAMCYWEEQHWIRTKSITAPEFFHGMFEIVDRDTAVTVFVGEDTQRPLSERVVKFLPRICANYSVIDSADYELKGISKEFRGSISHLVTHMVTERIDAHIEQLNCHPVEIRRYYRQLDY